MAANKQESGERYNPITGIGIPATPARINSSAIFGGSPSSIEYMFIPPSATTRSTKPPSSSEKRRSLSRESLRRSFPPVSEGQPDSDECSSVSDVSECGSEAEQRERSRSNLNALPRTGKPLSRSTSSRLPVSVARPRVMKRAHSFTRDKTSRSPRGTTNDPQVTHSASDLTNQLKKPNASAISKIPRKPTTSARTVGPQSSRLPVKRTDVNSNTSENGARKSGNQSTVVKRTEPQVSGIPVKPSTLQKRTTCNSKEPSETEATLKKTTATGSGIPVKGSGTKPQQHSGSSRIPQLKLDGPPVGTSNESEQPNENIDRVNDDIKIAMQAGKQLLQREGTGDELRVAKADAAKSKLPRRSSIPRSSAPKVVQKTKNGEKIGKESTNVKSQQTLKSSENGVSGSKVRTAGVSKIPVNKRVEPKPANRSPATPSSMSQGSDSGYGDTDSVSGKENATEEIGNEFCLSRENSKSKIPIMSRKGRTATKTSEAGPNEREVVGVNKEKTEKPKQESWPSDDSVPKESEITEKRSVSRSMLGLKQELTGKTSISRDSHSVAMQQPKVKELDVVLVTGENKSESESRGSADERLESGLGPSKGDIIAPDSLPSKSPNKELVTVATKPQRVQRESDDLHKRGGLVTKKDNNQVGNVLVPRTHADAPDTSSCDQTDVSSNNGYSYSAKDVQEMTSVSRHDASLPVGNQDDDVVSTKKKPGAETRSNLKKPGIETRSDLKEPGTETGSNLKKPGIEMRSNLKGPGAETRSNLKEPGQDSIDVNTHSNEKLKTETRGPKYNRTAGTNLEGKTRQLTHSEECLGDAGMENKNTVEFKMKIENEKHDASYDLEKQTVRYLDIQTRHLSEFDKRLEEPGVETEEPGVDTQQPGAKTEEPAKRSDTCFECRMEKSENEDDEVSEMDDIRRYPTFISPRKSLVLCKHHEKLKNETSQSADDLENHLVPMTSLPAVKNGHLSLEASPEILPKNPTNRGEHASVQEIEKTTAKITIEDKLPNHVSKSGFGVPVVDKFRETPKLKNAAPIRDINPVSKNEPPIRNIDKRKTAPNNAREKDAKNVGGPKGSHSPLLALSRDKKFVSGENLAAAKNMENIKSALSLEWDDIGTELDPPNFSEDDDDDILEPGVKKPGQDKGDSRAPGVKLMNTNEALDKLKVIQSLIMKEAENRSRKESEESTGKYAVGTKGPGNEQNVSRNIGMPMSPPLEKQRSNGYPVSNQVSPTSEVSRREVSSPTIWDKISDNTISQDQTTELLNETLAKLKASPQLSSTAFARRTISSRSLPGSRQTSKEQLLSDTERPVYVYTSSWMNRSGKNSRGSSLSLCSANRSLPSSRQNLAKDPFNALKRSESASGRIMEKENGKRIEGKEKKEFRLSDFDEINLSDDGIQELKNQKSNKPSVSPVVEKPRIHDVQDIKPSLKMSKRRKKSKNTAATMNNVPLYGVSTEELADGKATCQCGGKKCVIS